MKQSKSILTERELSAVSSLSQVYRHLHSGIVGSNPTRELHSSCRHTHLEILKTTSSLR